MQNYEFSALISVLALFWFFLALISAKKKITAGLIHSGTGQVLYGWFIRNDQDKVSN